MNGISNSMLGMMTQSTQSTPSDPVSLMQQMLQKFEQEALQAKQESAQRTSQYQAKQTELGGQVKQAGERFATAPKAGAADIALTAASLILPVIGALLPQGRGRRGQRAKASKQQALTGLGQGLGQFQQLRLGREEKGRERQYAGEMQGLEHQSGLADMIYQGQEKQAATQLGAAGELMRGGIAVEKLGLPKAPDGRLALDREKFTYQKEQDRLDRQLQNAESTGRYPKGYLSAVAKLNQSLSTDIDLTEDQKREAFDLGILRLNRLYGIVPTGLSPRLGIGGGQPGLEEIEAELARRQTGGRP